MVIFLSDQAARCSTGDCAHKSTVTRLARALLLRVAVELVLGLGVVVLAVRRPVVVLIGLAMGRLSLVASAGCVPVVLGSLLAILSRWLTVLATLLTVLTTLIVGRVLLLVLLPPLSGMTVTLIVAVGHDWDWCLCGRVE